MPVQAVKVSSDEMTASFLSEWVLLLKVGLNSAKWLTSRSGVKYDALFGSCSMLG